MQVPSTLFSMMAGQCLPARRLGGRAPLALHIPKTVMNLFSPTSTDRVQWGNLARSLEVENVTKQKLSHSAGDLAGGMVLESSGSYFHLLVYG